MAFALSNDRFGFMSYIEQKKKNPAMIIDCNVLNELSKQAKESPRLRINMDLRNSPQDQSQRMLNVLEPETVLPIHRHISSSETVVCVRGHFEEYFYNDEGVLTETIDMKPGGVILNVPIGQWHRIKCLESGTALLTVKDGPYVPLNKDEIWQDKYL